MDFDWPESAEAVRREARAWLDDVLPDDWAGTGTMPTEELHDWIQVWRK